jgi:glycosyltransferase involved in cell wall biosynthesis
LPNKLFDFLASARPVIVAGRGESADLVTRARAGMVVEPGSPESLSNAICIFQETDPSERDQMGANGRQYVKENFSREAHAARLIDIVNEASRH